VACAWGKWRQQLGLEEKEGLIVMAVDPNSAAEEARLKASDVLVRVNDKSVANDLDGFAQAPEG
jgi:S1-C subfamily serine protease